MMCGPRGEKGDGTTRPKRVENKCFRMVEGVGGKNS